MDDSVRVTHGMDPKVTSTIIPDSFIQGVLPGVFLVFFFSTFSFLFNFLIFFLVIFMVFLPSLSTSAFLVPFLVFLEGNPLAHLKPLAPPLF